MLLLFLNPDFDEQIPVQFVDYVFAGRRQGKIKRFLSGTRPSRLRRI